MNFSMKDPASQDYKWTLVDCDPQAVRKVGIVAWVCDLTRRYAPSDSYYTKWLTRSGELNELIQVVGRWVADQFATPLGQVMTISEVMAEFGVTHDMVMNQIVHEMIDCRLSGDAWLIYRPHILDAWGGWYLPYTVDSTQSGAKFIAEFHKRNGYTYKISTLNNETAELVRWYSAELTDAIAKWKDVTNT